MEENLEPNSNDNNKISKKDNKYSAEEIKEPKSEKDLNLNENSPKSQNNYALEVNKKMIMIHQLKLFLNKKKNSL